MSVWLTMGHPYYISDQHGLSGPLGQVGSSLEISSSESARPGFEFLGQGRTSKFLMMYTMILTNQGKERGETSPSLSDLIHGRFSLMLLLISQLSSLACNILKSNSRIKIK